MTTVSRRKLLVAGSGVIYALGCGPAAPPSLDAEIAAGNAKDLAPGTLKAIAGKGVAIARDAGGIYAMTLICTHEGCDMSAGGSLVSAGGIVCGCHESRFDAQGNVLRGPAGSPLVHLAVTEDASGNLTIHGDQTTPASARIPAA